jgi:hypothetical protein
MDRGKFWGFDTSIGVQGSVEELKNDDLTVCL